MRASVVHSDPHLRRTSWRLGLQTGILLVICLAVASTLVVLTVVRSQQAQVITTLDQAISTTHAGGDPGRDHDKDPASRDIAVAATDPHGSRVIGEMPAGLPDRGLMAAVAASRVTDQRTVRIADVNYAVRTAQRGDDTIQAVFNLREQEQELERLLRAVIVAVVAGVVLATAAAVWLARRAVRPLAQALTMQRRFVADASHELRTPLTLLSTRAQLLRRRLQRAELSQGPDRVAITGDVDGLVADARNLAEILEDLLLAADTRTPIPSAPVDLAQVVREAVAAASAEADDRGVVLTVVGDDAAVIPAGARPALQRAVTALIDNAVTHAHERATVRVTTQTTNVLIRVVDDGPGISDELMPHLFSRFSSRRPAEEGVSGRRHYGLGLALVSEVATRHGGSVVAMNRTDSVQGAELQLRLPRRRR